MDAGGNSDVMVASGLVGAFRVVARRTSMDPETLPSPA